MSQHIIPPGIKARLQDRGQASLAEFTGQKVIEKSKGCHCGYRGSGKKMAFDVDEAYNYLTLNLECYTVRPGHWLGLHSYRAVHIHRNHRFANLVGVKVVVAMGDGKENLLIAMKSYLNKSGFKSVDEWYGKLVDMHGAWPTTHNWTMYRVEVHHYTEVKEVRILG